jgi:hypothetical protein
MSVCFVSDHTDPEVGDAVIKFFGHQPTSGRYQQPELEYTGRDAIVVFSDSVLARLLLMKPSQAFFGMYQQNVLRHTPYGQLDVRHLFKHLDLDMLTVSISGLAYCYGNNILGIRQVEVCDN